MLFRRIQDNKRIAEERRLANEGTPVASPPLSLTVPTVEHERAIAAQKADFEAKLAEAEREKVALLEQIAKLSETEPGDEGGEPADATDADGEPVDKTDPEPAPKAAGKKSNKAK